MPANPLKIGRGPEAPSSKTFESFLHWFFGSWSRSDKVIFFANTQKLIPALNTALCFFISMFFCSSCKKLSG